MNYKIENSPFVLSRYTSEVIRFDSVRKRYPGSDVEVLRGIDLEIGDHDFVAVVGRSGSGKTTLLNLIGALDSDFTGTVEVNGRDVGALPDRAASSFRNTEVGHVFQSYHLLDHLTCEENVALASLFARGEARHPSEFSHRRAGEVLEIVGLGGSGRRSPTTLSGGERQRVALARALFHSPPILLCDEPTGNLDAETGREVVELLQLLNQEHGITIVAATHDEAISSEGGRVLHLSEGRFTDEDRGGNS